MYGGFVNKFLFYLVAFLPLPFLIGCPGKGGSNNNSNVVIGGIPAGGFGFLGTLVSINPSTCGGATSATVTISQAGYAGGGNAICTQPVAIGGQFNCPVPANTQYFISVQTVGGGCSVQGNMSPLTSGSPPLQVCLGGGCTCYNYQNCLRSKAQSDVSSIQLGFPGSGDLKINSSALYLKSSKNTPFELEATTSNGNNILNGEGHWKGSLATDGTMSVGSESVVDKLTYSAQVDASLLQYSQGFCDASSVAARVSASHAAELGYSPKAIESIYAGFASLSGRVCVYPQTDAEISRAVTLKSNLTMNTYRLWLIVVEENQLGANLKSITRPKNALAKAGDKIAKSRKIASSNDLLVEEIGLGFLIKK